MIYRRQARVQVFLVVLFLAGAASAETIELVTYYPAPGGGDVSAPRLHADQATIGDNYSLTNPAALPNGYLLVWDRLGVGLGLNLPLGPLHVVGRDDVVESVVFMPGADTGAAGVPELRVGIGTAQPQALPGGAGTADQTNLDIRRNLTVGGTAAANIGSLNWREYDNGVWWHLSLRGGGNLELHGRPNPTSASVVIPLTTTLAGNVGIGMTDPQQKLDVSGNAHVSGNVQVDGTLNGAKGVFIHNRFVGSVTPGEPNPWITDSTTYVDIPNSVEIVNLPAGTAVITYSLSGGSKLPASANGVAGLWHVRVVIGSNASPGQVWMSSAQYLHFTQSGSWATNVIGGPTPIKLQVENWGPYPPSFYQNGYDSIAWTIVVYRD